MSDTTHPRIYVASLADYNAGRLHGAWIDAAQPYEDLQRDVDRMLAASREPVAEEWAIHDYEGFAPLELAEYDDLQSVARIAAGIVAHGVAFAAWSSTIDRALWDEQLDQFDDRFVGHYDSLNSWAVEALEECDLHLEDHVPSWLLPHVRIDIEAFARDLALDFELVEALDSVWVFAPG